MSMHFEMPLAGGAGKRAVITGANRGIGWQTARALARAGYEVTLAVRDEEAGHAASRALTTEFPFSTSRVEVIDLSDLDSVRACAARMLAAGNPIDVLINNAAIYRIPQATRSAQGIEMQFATNFLGHFALTALILPLIMNQPGARIVGETSVLHQLTGKLHLDEHGPAGKYGPTRAYAMSKTANILFVRELERRLRAVGATAISLGSHPGVANTDIHRKGPSQGGWSLGNRLVSGFSLLVSQPVGVSARSQIFAATDARAEGGVIYGPDGLLELHGTNIRASRISRLAREESAAAELWAHAEVLSGVTFPI